jgi:hypothetical protein
MTLASSLARYALSVVSVEIRHYLWAVVKMTMTRACAYPCELLRTQALWGEHCPSWSFLKSQIELACPSRVPMGNSVNTLAVYCN